MKKIIIIMCAFIFSTAGRAQGIKQLTVDQLDAYIAKSEKPLIVNFWATWCASCVEEIPYFISTVNEKYKNDVELLLVSLDVKAYYPKKIAAFASKRNFNTAIAWLNEKNADVFCPRIDKKWSGAIPSTLMVNNKKQYRKFYEQGLSPLQFEREVKLLME